MKTVYALLLSGLVFIAVAVREWNYRSTHPYALGPSGYIVALGVAGAIAAFATAARMYNLNQNGDSLERALFSQTAALDARIAELQGELRTLTVSDLEINKLEQDMEYEDVLVAGSAGLTVEEFDALPGDERGAILHDFWERPENWIELRGDELAKSANPTPEEFAALPEDQQRAIVIDHWRSSGDDKDQAAG